MRARASIALALVIGFAVVLLTPEPRRTLLWQLTRLPRLPALSLPGQEGPHPSLVGVRLHTPGAWAALGPHSHEIAAQIRRQAEANPGRSDLWVTAGLLGWIGPKRPDLPLFRRAVQAAPEDVAAHIWLARALMFRYHLDALAAWPTRPRPAPRPDPARLDSALPHIMRASALDPQNGYPDQLLAYVRFAQGRQEEALGLVEKSLDKPRWRSYDAQTRRLVFIALRRTGLPEPLALVYTRSDPWPAVYLSHVGWDVTEAGRGFEEAGNHERAIACYALTLSLGELLRDRAETPSSEQTGRLITRQVAGRWRVDRQAVPPDMRPPGRYALRYRPGAYVHDVYTREAQYGFIRYLRSHGAQDLAVRTLFQWSISDSEDRSHTGASRRYEPQWPGRLRPLGIVYLAWSAQIIFLACALAALGLALVAWAIAAALGTRTRERIHALAAADSQAARLARVVLSTGPLLIGVARVLIVEPAKGVGSGFAHWHASTFGPIAAVAFAILATYAVGEVAWRRKRTPTQDAPAWALWAVRVWNALLPLAAVFLACYLLLFLACPGPLRAVHLLAREQVRVFYLPSVPLP